MIRLFPVAGLIEDALVPLVALVVIFGIPIVAILTKHQQKMALIFRNDQQAQVPQQPEIEALRQEVSELKGLVNRLAISMDDMAASQRQSPPAAPADIRERLSS